MTNNATLLGNMIRDGRERLHLTQEEIADKLQVNLTHYGNIERGTGNPSLPLFIEIMKILNLSVDAYLYPEKAHSDNTFQEIIRLLCQCSEKERKIILANIHALIKYRDEDTEKL